MFDKETTGDGNGEVQKILGALPRVDAPGDFDFKVRARIANGSSPRLRPFRLVTGIGLAAPAIAAVVFGAYWFMQPQVGPGPAENYLAAVTPSAEVSVPVTASTLVSAPLAASSLSAAPVSEGPNEVVRERQVTAPVAAAPAVPAANSGGGSIDIAGREPAKIYARGISPGPRTERRSREIQPSAGIPARAILDSLGAQGEFDAAGFKISAVRASSVADTVGLRAGDVVVSINEQAINRETAFKGAFTGRSVRVIRGGESVQIPLSTP